MTTLHGRIESTAPALEFSTTKELLSAILRDLKKASDAGRLNVADHDLRRYVAIASPPRDLAAKHGRQARAIDGGVKDFDRRPESAELVRADAAWFHFTLTVIERPGERLAMVAYNFELVFDASCTPPFLRFDLNAPDHANAGEGLRSHLHPGNDDLQLPFPILHPLEAIGLMLTLTPP